MSYINATIGKAVIGETAWNGGESLVVPRKYRQNLYYPVRNKDAVDFFCINQKPICFAKPITTLDGIRYSSLSGYMINRELVDFVLGWYDRVRYETMSNFESQTIGADTNMVTWDKFHEYVLPSVQGCPVSMVNSAIRSACIEFCEKTLLWKQDSITNDLIEDYDLYIFAPPPNAKVIMPYRVSIDGKEVQPTDLQTLESFAPNWKDLKEEFPKYYFMVSDNTIRLVGTPTKTYKDALTADVALKPSREAKQCPTFIFNDWAETIAAGALARLHAMKDKVWALPELVGHYTKAFREGISRARSKSAKSWLQESKTMLPVGFYNEKRYY